MTDYRLSDDKAAAEKLRSAAALAGEVKNDG